MRAVFFPELFQEKEVELQKEKTHHFLNVLKLRDGEKILVLNGLGQSVISTFEILNKKQTFLKATEEIQVHNVKLVFDVLIGKLKKEAMDLAVRNLAELGARNIYITHFEYAQNYPLNFDRLDKVVVSAMEQSNNFFKPKIIEININDFLFDYDQIFLFSTERDQNIISTSYVENTLLVLGPEGGFGPQDYELLNNQKNINYINFPTPILRASNAASCAVGYLCGLQACKS